MRATHPGGDGVADNSWAARGLSGAAAAAAAAVALLLSPAAPALAATLTSSPYSYSISVDDPEGATMENVPGSLSSLDSMQNKPSKSSQMRRDDPKVAKLVQACVRKCIPTCIRGGAGAPGLGPASLRKAPVKFKDGYRSRDYCLGECVDVCSVTDGKVRQ